jgi:hypothetical protein
MEAPSLRRWKLSRRGFGNVGLVVGDDRETAERRFFDSWVARGPDDDDRPEPTPPPALPSPFARPASSDIVGLFPQPEPRS